MINNIVGRILREVTDVCIRDFLFAVNDVNEHIIFKIL